MNPYQQFSKERIMDKEKPPKKQISTSDRTMCEATQQMLNKARRDSVTIDLDRGYDMKACPIGEKSACNINIALWDPAGLIPMTRTRKWGSAVQPLIS
jgi:hypothetical protein